MSRFLKWTLIIGLSILLLATLAYQSRFLLKSPKDIFLDRFLSEDVSYRFQSYATKISGKQSLHVASLNQIEVIERSSQAKALWMTLPKVIVRLEVPVEYNFYIHIGMQWKFERSQTGLAVHVPELSSGTPAPNLAKMKLELTKGNFLFNENSAKQKMQQEVQDILVEKSILYRDQVREQAREAIREFVSSWLLQLGNSGDANLPVQIYFPTEESPRPRS